MTSIARQQGATLVVSMIMLVVITVLVVFSIRSGNTNLRIAGNMQYQTEAFMATQQVIEQVIEQVKVTEVIGQITAQTVTVPMGSVNYSVAVAPMGTCQMEVPILNSELNPAVADDVPCIESADSDQAIRADGTLISKPSACKTQWWEINAEVTEGNSGVRSTQVQGLSVRAPATVSCL
jgi:hypothetical protein